MDPNATLAEIRSRIAGIATALQAEEWQHAAITGALLADDMEALDEWLSKGGFLPDAWQR